MRNKTKGVTGGRIGGKRKARLKLRAADFRPAPVERFALFDEVVHKQYAHPNKPKAQRLVRLKKPRHLTDRVVSNAMRGPMDNRAATSGYIPIAEVCSDRRIQEAEAIGARLDRLSARFWDQMGIQETIKPLV